MISLKRILVPTDFSEPARKALAYGEALAAAFGASLEVLHVVSEPPMGWAVEGYVPPPQAYREGLLKSAADQLAAELSGQGTKGKPVKQVVRLGNPFTEITRYAQAEEVDLVVMGTHGRGMIAHLLMGSVAERVVRTAPCPVLTVRHPEHEFVLPD